MEHISVEGSAAAAQAVDPANLSTSCTASGTLRPLGMVRGITVRSRNVVANIGAGFKALAGGEISTFTTLCETARQEALTRMLEQAAEVGANGVICVRYDTNQISQGITEVLAYGMAVTDAGSSVLVPAMVAPAAEDQGIHNRFICSSNELPGYTVHRSLGVVSGITVRCRNIAMAIGAVGKSLVGGEIRNWTKMCDDARQQAYTRMIEEAVSRGADGIVGMRYSTNEVKEGITEVIAYGTAVSSTPAGPDDHAAVNWPCHVTTSNSLPGIDAAHSYGIVKGISVRSCNVFRSIGASFKSLAGGELRNWTDMCTETRALAFERMLEEATRLGAKGIVGMRYDASQVTDSAVVEVIAYGTAVSDQPLVAEVATTELPQNMVTTDLQIPGQVVNRSLGLVRGISVKAVNIFLDIGAVGKSLVGGEIRNYTAMCEAARQEAYGNMMKHAYDIGATGVTAMRFESNDIVPGAIEVVAYGTAVSDGSRPPVNAEASGPLGPGTATPIDLACLSTTNEVAGQNFENSLGIVRGITCRSRNFFANFGASMKAGFVGGEIQTWATLCEQTRVEATKRIIEDAASRGARGIVGMRYETNEICPGVSETVAFGTAVA